ncbi:universal stress protein [Streptomyces sp. SID9727]|uniref:universal stress protein n=1 Tax=Streptomyces sp. SID9727 TaxID=2706114 RepID=UPI0013C6130D|nr:universal stress protein [Streptomyces sp. SID9727]
MQHQPVIAGIDITPDSLLAAGWAADEARRRSAPLLLLHGHDPSFFADAGTERQAAEQALAGTLDWVREHYGDVEASAELVDRPEADLLTERGREAQMVVVGSRRPGPVTGFLLGSVGLRVLSRADCPVVLIRGGDVSRRPRSGEVVAGVPEEDHEAEAVLDFAFRAAVAHGVPLRAARAWDLPTMFTNQSGVMGLSNRPAQLAEDHRRALVTLLRPWRRRYPDVTVTEHTEVGFAAEMLVSLAAGAQLLVLGRSSRTGSRYVGHVVHSTLHFANAPIAVVPTKGSPAG